MRSRAQRTARCWHQGRAAAVKIPNDEGYFPRTDLGPAGWLPGWGRGGRPGPGMKSPRARLYVSDADPAVWVPQDAGIWSECPYGAYYPTPEGNLPAAIGVQPELG